MFLRGAGEECLVLGLLADFRRALSQKVARTDRNMPLMQARTIQPAKYEQKLA